MNIFRFRTSLRAAISLAAAIGLSAGGFTASANAQTAPTSADTQTLRLAGARSQGALLTPSARLLERHAWDVSMTYNFDAGVMRTTVLTGEVRGPNTREEIRWLNQRHSVYAQFAFAPAERVELLFGLPVLINQSSEAGVIVDAAPTGSAALGDMRMIGRVALLRPDTSPLSWNLDLGLMLPSGTPAYLYGEKRVRYILGSTLGAQLPKNFRIDARIAHENAPMSTVGNQILGDTLIAQFAVSHDVLKNLRWFVELSNVNVISSSPPGAEPKRNALEVGAGARYFFEQFYLDAGFGFGALDVGYTPRLRAQFSIGTTGNFTAKKAAAAAEATATQVQLSEQTLAELRTLLLETQTPAHAHDTHCVRPDAQYTGALTEQGCIDFNSLHSTEGFQKRSLEETKIYFELNKSTLTASSSDTVRKVALILMHNPGNIRVAGHADDQGTDALNERLSRERAQTVLQALVDAGVDAERLRMDSQGSTLPISPDTDFGRSINRRVDFHWE